MMVGDGELPGPSTSPFLDPDSRSYPRDRSPIGKPSSLYSRSTLLDSDVSVF